MKLFLELYLILRRHMRAAAIAFGSIFLVFVVFASQWSRYSVSATIDISQPLISQTVTNLSGADVRPIMLADRRVRMVEQQVTRTESLKPIIDALKLYPKLSKTLNADQLAEHMRKHLKLKFITNSIAVPSAIQRESIDQLSASGFTIRFEYNDPTLAAAALKQIVEKFIATDKALRIAQASETAAFLDLELQSLSEAISKQEKEVAAFRAQYGDMGKEAVQKREQQVESTALNQQNLENALATNQATITTLRGQLAATDAYLTRSDLNGNPLHSAGSQLKTLQAQLSAALGRYGPDHPDVVKLKAQINALKPSARKAPAVIRDADNPTYLQLAAQLDEALAQQTVLRAQLQRHETKQEKFAHVAENSPELEEQYAKLSLDLDNAKLRYRQLMDKHLAAKMQQALEKSDNSARLILAVEPAPPTHTSPSRKLLIVAGLWVSLLAGALIALLFELMNPAIRTPRQLRAITGALPLISIPPLQNAAR